MRTVTTWTDRVPDRDSFKSVVNDICFRPDGAQVGFARLCALVVDLIRGSDSPPRPRTRSACRAHLTASAPPRAAWAPAWRAGWLTLLCCRSWWPRSATGCSCMTPRTETYCTRLRCVARGEARPQLSWYRVGVCGWGGRARTTLIWCAVSATRATRTPSTPCPTPAAASASRPVGRTRPLSFGHLRWVPCGSGSTAGSWALQGVQSVCAAWAMRMPVDLTGLRATPRPRASCGTLTTSPFRSWRTTPSRSNSRGERPTMRVGGLPAFVALARTVVSRCVTGRQAADYTLLHARQHDRGRLRALEPRAEVCREIQAEGSCALRLLDERRQSARARPIQWECHHQVPLPALLDRRFISGLPLSPRGTQHVLQGYNWPCIRAASTRNGTSHPSRSATRTAQLRVVPEPMRRALCRLGTR